MLKKPNTLIKFEDKNQKDNTTSLIVEYGEKEKKDLSLLVPLTTTSRGTYYQNDNIPNINTLYGEITSQYQFVLIVTISEEYFEVPKNFFTNL